MKEKGEAHLRKRSTFRKKNLSFLEYKSLVMERIFTSSYNYSMQYGFGLSAGTSFLEKIYEHQVRYLQRCF